MVSLVADADQAASAVAVSAAEPRAGLANVNVIYRPALALSGPLLLDPAELSRSTEKFHQTQQITKVLQVTTGEIGACNLHICADQFG